MRIFYLLCLSILFLHCKTETTVEKQTVTIHDTISIPLLINDTVTTIILLRHAEKDSVGADPNLSLGGQLRADELKRILENVVVNKIYSTPYNRTRQTIAPVATAKGISVTDYATSLSYSQLITQLINENKNKTAVVVGHSNTVPEILKAFSNNTFVVQIADSQYDNLFVVTVPNNGIPRIHHLKYGKATP